MVALKSDLLDYNELRFNLLFWEKIIWPRLHQKSATRPWPNGNGPNELFLENEGILERPEFCSALSLGAGLAMAQIETFLKLESEEPGKWTLAQGDKSLLAASSKRVDVVGMALSFGHFIPIPTQDLTSRYNAV